MSIFIKAGLWIEKRIGNTAEFNLTQYIQQFSGIGVTNVTATTPLSSSGGLIPNITIQQSNDSQSGYLSSIDWNIFNSKQPQLNGLGFIKASGSTITYDNSVYLTTISGIVAGGELSGTYANPSLVNSAVTGKVLTGFNVIGSNVISTDSILTAFGKVQNQINGLLSGSIYQGIYNATTNIPILIDGVGTLGYYYVVSVGGSQNFGSGVITFNVGDWAIYNGSTWDKVDNTDAVSSVNGFIGAVNLTSTNIPEGLTNLYYTDVRARNAISAGTNITYSPLTGIITNSAPDQTVTITGTSPIVVTGTYPNFTASIIQSSTSTNGYLSSTNWNTFNNKQNALSGTGIVKSTAGVISYVNGTSSQLVQGDGSLFDKFNQSITSGTQIDTTSVTDVVVTGMTITPPAGTYKVDFNGNYDVIPGNVCTIASLDLQNMYLTLLNTPATATHGLTFGSGETLTAGVYTVAGAMSVAGTLTLDGGGNPNALFIFRVTGAINTAIATTIQLTNSANAANVFFMAIGAVGIVADNVVSGNFIAYGAAAALGANCIFNGRLFSTSGALAFSSGIQSKPTAISVINMGILENFLCFTNQGNVANTALAVITGDLGTNFGNVTVFATSVFNGNAYDDTQQLGSTNMFSIYNGAVMVPNSSRLRRYYNYTEDVALTCVTTVDGTQAISVNWRTDVGRCILNNRILTIVKL